MLDRKTLEPLLIAVGAGMLLWLVAAQLIEAREPWDDTAYWTIAYPLALVSSAILGYFYADRPWRWALTVFWAQVAAMWILSGELGNLWPMTLVFTAIIAIPAMLAATLSARLSKRQKP